MVAHKVIASLMSSARISILLTLPKRPPIATRHSRLTLAVKNKKLVVAAGGRDCGKDVDKACTSCGKPVRENKFLLRMRQFRAFTEPHAPLRHSLRLFASG